MKQIDLNQQYTISELATITGINLTRFYSYRDKIIMDKFLLDSRKVGYGIYLHHFENALDECKTFDFDIPEFHKYRQQKRPIVRQFLDSNEITRFLSLLGDPLSIYTVKRRIREDIYPTYALERKYLCPIVYLVRRYLLPIDEDLNRLIGTVINDNSYKFKL